MIIVHVCKTGFTRCMPADQLSVNFAALLRKTQYDTVRMGGFV